MEERARRGEQEVLLGEVAILNRAVRPCCQGGVRGNGHTPEGCGEGTSRQAQSKCEDTSV